jgi:hypothetical protein
VPSNLASSEGIHRRSPSIAKNLSLVLAAALFIQIAHAQAVPKPYSTPKPPDSPSKVLLDSWNDVGRKLFAMAEDFPEGKYDFKPNPAQRSFADQLLHAAANVNCFVNNLAKGMRPPTCDVKRADYSTKAAAVKYVRKSFAEGAALIKSKGDGGLNDLCIDPFTNQKDRFSDLAWGFIEHSGEHYGQLVVYYRVAGMVPPESREGVTARNPKPKESRAMQSK